LAAVRFAMKAAAASAPQLHDRVVRMRRMRLPIALELHTTRETLSDPGALTHSRRLVAEEAATLTVHTPFQAPDADGLIDFDEGAVRRSAEFAHTVGADAVVVHRVSGSRMNGTATQQIPRDAQAAVFNERIDAIAAEFPTLRFLVENVGFLWLSSRDSSVFAIGPLDHFFPWEIREFCAFARARRANLGVVLDIAHAAISANMFALLRTFPSRFALDPRFAGITSSDLERIQRLSPFDFFPQGVAHFHVSDFLRVRQRELGRRDAPRPKRVHELLTTEGEALGYGDLDAGRLARRLAAGTSDLTAVAEIRPAPGGSHDASPEQERAIEMLRCEIRAHAPGRRPPDPSPQRGAQTRSRDRRQPREARS
jgi:Xylose isomerase-like TIM barrel